MFKSPPPVVKLNEPNDPILEKLLLEEVSKGEFTNFKNYCRNMNITDLSITSNDQVFCNLFCTAIEKLPLVNIKVNRSLPAKSLFEVNEEFDGNSACPPSSKRRKFG